MAHMEGRHLRVLRVRLLTLVRAFLPPLRQHVLLPLRLQLVLLVVRLEKGPLQEARLLASATSRRQQRKPHVWL